jgi:hypothetical protein
MIMASQHHHVTASQQLPQGRLDLQKDLLQRLIGIYLDDV